jgi:hypothetical protein
MIFALAPTGRMRRSPGTGHIYVKHGAYYVRWRGADGSNHNRRLGKVRTRGEADGLTRAQAERGARTLIEKEAANPARVIEAKRWTVNDAADALRDRLVLAGARTSYLQNCESMQRVHIAPALGKRRVDVVTSSDVERLTRAMLNGGATPKTVRNTITFLHSVFTLAIRKGGRRRTRSRAPPAHGVGAPATPTRGCSS